MKIAEHSLYFLPYSTGMI